MTAPRIRPATVADADYGSAMVEHARSMALTSGLTAVELDVSFSNPRAQRLYERLGWVATGERPAPAGCAHGGFRRMRRRAG
ncbi:GNAT family N-acetyltransferase [Actinoplanes sp. NPDC049118]|uniref:GNAT family N-acetyltransferase n=1 Tax=Actinoplanes sp. NPDC049118 TaxID=3155769 RepID=UPI0033C5FFE2